MRRRWTSLKNHFLDWSGKEDRAACGVILGEYTQWVAQRKNVTCRACLKRIKP
jgi:hypothetical protein